MVDLAGMMANLNRLIFDATPINRYATFFYGQYDPANRKLVYVTRLRRALHNMTI